MLSALFRQLLHPDIAFALVLMLVAISIFFAVRIGVLPKKSAPFVGAALLAAIGFSMYRERHARNLQNVLKEKEKELRLRDKQLEKLKQDYQLSDREADAAVAKRKAEVQALSEEILQMRKDYDKQIEQVKKMTPEERVTHVLNLNFE